jgi:hypothetical protein
MTPAELAQMLGRDPTKGQRPLTKDPAKNVVIYRWWDEGKLRSASAQIEVASGSPGFPAPTDIEGTVRKLRQLIVDQAKEDVELKRMIDLKHGLTIGYVDIEGHIHGLWPLTPQEAGDRAREQARKKRAYSQMYLYQRPLVSLSLSSITDA